MLEIGRCCSRLRRNTVWHFSESCERHPVYGGSGWMLFFTSTDWRKAVYENGFQHKHTVNISSGGENSSYYLSGSYADQEGVIRYADDNNKRYNLRMNYDLSKRIRLETKLSLENQKRSDVGGVGTYLITESIFGTPNHPVYTKSGTKYFAQGGWGNAVAMAKEGASYVFNNKYIVEANLRYDGSSRFQKSTKWGLFPGVSVGWRMSEENFYAILKYSIA